MNILVAYMSQTGNTQKVAEAIYEAIPKPKAIKRIDDIQSLDGYDLAFLGFPTHAFGPDEPVITFLNAHVKDKTIALFITHAAPEGGSVVHDWMQKFKDAAEGANLVGMFDCQGQLAQPVKTTMLNHPDPQIRTWAQSDNSHGQPDETRLKRARMFAQEILTRAQAY